MKSIPVCYTPEMSVDFSSFSPSAGKPALVVADWQRLGLPVEVMAPPAIERAQLQRVHDAAYVDAVLDGHARNGFRNNLPEVATSLLYTNGAMLAAAREAVRNRAVAVAPCSGFHHARYDRPEGYCTFNGLMVTAFALKAEGLANRVGILDFDMHFGDGTDALITEHACGYWIEHCSAGRKYFKASQSEEFLTNVPGWVVAMQNCDVILYQAGADPHIADPHGGFLTTEQLRMRDRMVFSEAHRLGIPIAWNLAGGYQRDEQGKIDAVLEIHNNTMRECMSVYAPSPR